MDPNATYQLFRSLLASGDRLGACEPYSNLAQWLYNGGFEPNWLATERQLFFAFESEFVELTLG